MLHRRGFIQQAGIIFSGMIVPLPTVPGIFACGDNTTRMRTVTNAVAMGTATGMMLNKELIEQNFNQDIESIHEI